MTSNITAASSCALEIYASLGFDRSSASFPIKSQRVQDKFSRFCRFQANDMIVGWLTFSLGRKSRHCSPHLTSKPGMGAAIARFF